MNCPHQIQETYFRCRIHEGYGVKNYFITEHSCHNCQLLQRQGLSDVVASSRMLWNLATHTAQQALIIDESEAETCAEFLSKLLPVICKPEQREAIYSKFLESLAKNPKIQFATIERIYGKLTNP